MKKVLRIGYNRYYTEQIFQEHLEFIRKNAEVIDEITVFTEFSHYGYWDLEWVKENASVLKDRIKRYKDVGIKKVGINILSTIGHMEEGWDVLPQTDMQHIVGQDGTESKCCLCPSGEDFLEYIGKRYAYYANIGADFIWLDDDLRTTGHGNVAGHCFCPQCIARFNQETGNCYSVELVREKFSRDKDLTREYKDFMERVIQRLLHRIADAIRKINPDLEIGYMDIGMDIGQGGEKWWREILGASKMRPGHSFYTDMNPMGVFNKHLLVQRLVDAYPKEITDIQYEYEAFNYQTLEKSIHMSELESTLALMAGCTGVLYNNFIPLDRQDLLDMMKASAKKWEILARLNEGCKHMGIYCVSNQTAGQFNEIGIPVTFQPEHAVAAVVLKDEWEKLSDSEIEQLLKLHVLTDGRGLEYLHERGFSQQCGGSVLQVYTNSMAERFTEHDCNGSYKNFYRDTYMTAFIDSNAYEFMPEPEAECVSCLETITHQPKGCSMYLYEKEGVRIAADGFLMPSQMKTAPKKYQITQVLDWLSGGRLPVRIDKGIKVIPDVVADRAGNMNIMLTNASLDKTGSFVCVVRNDREFRILGPQGEEILPKQEVIDGECRIYIENIDAWNYLLLTNRPW